MIKEDLEPRLLKFPKIGDPGLGYISVSESQTLPIKVNRVYWTYFTPEDVSRGRHAHYQTDQILIAAAGKIIIKTESARGKKKEFILDRPNIGLLLPRLCWHEMSYSHNSVQVCLANMEYSESDYIRDYDIFIKLRSR